MQSSTTAAEPWRSGRALALICGLAVVLRVASAIWLPNVVYPDETFQYLEQANRLLTGRGMAPWEYAVGARSWLIPGALAGVMAPATWVSESPEIRLAAATAAMIGLALACVCASFTLGQRAGGKTHAIAAGLVAAAWCELIYYSTHVLADTIAAALLISGLAAAYRRPPSEPRRTFLVAGLLLGAACVVRPQLAPAAAVIAAGLGGLRPQRYLAMAAGGLVPVALLGDRRLDHLGRALPLSLCLRLGERERDGRAVRPPAGPLVRLA